MLDYAIEAAKQKLKLIALNKRKRQMQQLRTIVKRQKTEGQKVNLLLLPSRKETEN